MTSRKARILLNMIVKNESRIILRALESTVPFIDGVIIMDTGSTDNTIELINEFLAKYPTLRGKVVSEPIAADDFTFSGARTRALHHCIDAANWADYILFMDADMVLEIGDPDFSIEVGDDIPRQVRYLTQRNNLLYSNVRLIPLIAEDIATEKVTFRTYTHEFISHSYAYGPTIPYNTLGIHDIGDGGAKGNKMPRDLRLLLKGLREDADDLKCRYMFYLGETYRHMAQSSEYEPEVRNALLAQSIKYYSDRAAITNSWIQEVWYSYYAMGKCYMAMTPAQPDKAVYCWMQAYEVYPHRIENLYACADFFCMTERKYKQAHVYYNLAAAVLENGLLSTPVAREEQLFLQRDIYDFRLKYLYTILAPYMGIRNLSREIAAVLNAPELPDAEYTAVFNNMQFYNTILCGGDVGDSADEYDDVPVKQVIEYSCNLGPGDDSSGVFVNSSACLVGVPDSDEMEFYVRYVNYRIARKTGAYSLIPEGETRIITRTVCRRLTRAFQDRGAACTVPFDDRVAEVAPDDELAVVAPSAYVGIEDVRVFRPKGAAASDPAYFLGTTWHATRQTMGAVFGRVGSGEPAPIQSPDTPCPAREIIPGFIDEVRCEKNWVFCDYKGATAIIYEWYGKIENDPKDSGHVIICTVANSDSADMTKPLLLDMVDAKPVPPIFRRARGSSSGVWVGDSEIWFLVHFVAHGNPRRYYHMFAVFDAEMNYKSHSAPFSFEGCPIEYSLSMLYRARGDKICVSYSTWDSSTKIALYDRAAISLF
jgi:glycosyltransferase involved in cell wall biosynthesis